MKKYISPVLVVCLLNLLTSCYSLQTSTKDELINSKEYPSVLIKKYNKETYLLEENNYTLNNDSITGVSWQRLENGARVNKTVRTISISEIDSVEISKFDTASTIVYAVVCVGVSVLIVYGIKSLMESTTEGIAKGIGQGLGELFK